MPEMHITFHDSPLQWKLWTFSLNLSRKHHGNGWMNFWRHQVFANSERSQSAFEEKTPRPNNRKWNNLLSWRVKNITESREYWKIAPMTCLWASAVYHFNAKFFHRCSFSLRCLCQIMPRHNMWHLMYADFISCFVSFFSVNCWVSWGGS